MKELHNTEYTRTKVRRVISLNKQYFILETEVTNIVPKPGQFYLLKSDDCERGLHIPVSIYDSTPDYLQFMVKVVGKGTEALSDLKVNEKIKILGPLGTAFPLQENKKVVLISGGIGYAPLYYLKKKLISCGNKVTWLHGGKSKDDVFAADYVYTEDGSVGTKGLVTSELLDFVNREAIEVAYCCGPKAMMKSVAKLLGAHQLELYVSLEEYMACGLGACMGCAVSIKTGSGVEYKTVCNDGAVFDAKEVIWDE